MDTKRCGITKQAVDSQLWTVDKIVLSTLPAGRQASTKYGC
jgi:hypothetical protein